MMCNGNWIQSCEVCERKPIVMQCHDPGCATYVCSCMSCVSTGTLCLAPFITTHLCSAYLLFGPSISSLAFSSPSRSTRLYTGTARPRHTVVWYSSGGNCSRGCIRGISGPGYQYGVLCVAPTFACGSKCEPKYCAKYADHFSSSDVMVSQRSCASSARERRLPKYRTLLTSSTCSIWADSGEATGIKRPRNEKFQDNAETRRVRKRSKMKDGMSSRQTRFFTSAPDSRSNMRGYKAFSHAFFLPSCVAMA